MSEPHLLSELRDGVLLLTLNRPAARNAISPEMACRLADALEGAAADDAVRVVVLTGAGERAFCSGGDLALTLPLLTGARAPADAWDRRLLEDPSVLERSAMRDVALDKPVIAAVNGACLAGGMETMLATDLRVAAEHASFGLPEVRRALIPFAGSMARLPRQIPYCQAMELLLLGESVGAHEALRMGLLNRVVPGRRGAAGGDGPGPPPRRQRPGGAARDQAHGARLQRPAARGRVPAGGREPRRGGGHAGRARGAAGVHGEAARPLHRALRPWEGSKNLLFLKKKKQKDFAPLAPNAPHVRCQTGKSFLVLFFKKEPLPSLPA